MKNNDYEVKTIKVLSRPKLHSTVNAKTGEVEHNIKETTVQRKSLTIIVKKSYSLPLEPFNMYLHSRLRDGVKSTSSDAHALLSFQRFLDAKNLTYQSLTDDPEEGVVWRYADYLKDNTKKVCEGTGRVLENAHGYSYSSTLKHIDVVINFYKFLHNSGLFLITRDKKPFRFEYVTLRKAKKANQHDILAHTQKNRKIQIQTTDIKKRFPKVQSRLPHQVLKPMSVEHKKIFIKQLDDLPKTYSNSTQSLMFRLAVETGLRVAEMSSFPALGVHLPTSDLDEIPFAIGPGVGSNTKYEKERVIKIPYDLMLELHAYLNSGDRKKMLERRNKTLKKQYDRVDFPDFARHQRSYIITSTRGVYEQRQTVYPRI